MGEDSRVKKEKWGAIVQLAAAGAAVLVLALSLMMREAKAPVEEDLAALEETPAPAAAVSEHRERIGKGCAVIQTMGFSRCGHSVTRRTAAPEALCGADFSAAQAYYALWHIESFAQDQIAMSRDLPLYCPMHQVLGINEAGEVVLCRNEYGDGMAVKKSCGALLEDYDEETRQALVLGIGFDTEEEALKWLAAH